MKEMKKEEKLLKIEKDIMEHFMCKAEYYKEEFEEETGRSIEEDDFEYELYSFISERFCEDGDGTSDCVSYIEDIIRVLSEDGD